MPLPGPLGTLIAPGSGFLGQVTGLCLGEPDPLSTGPREAADTLRDAASSRSLRGLNICIAPGATPVEAHRPGPWVRNDNPVGPPRPPL